MTRIMINIKSKREIELLRNSCILAAQTLDYLGKQLKIGMTTEEIDNIAHDYIKEHNAVPSPLNYHGFPKSICTSKNEVICHGIPTPNDVLQDGDIVNLDVTTYLNKFHGDTNKTYFIGNVDPEIQKFVQVVHDCMMYGIEQVRPGGKLGDVGAAIEEMAKDHGFGVVHEYCGHGIGRDFHEEPQVLHYGKRGTGVELKPGMTFTIEPMINMGKRYCKQLKDGWTVVTRDGSWSAQFEHTLVVTEEGYDILTVLEGQEP